MLNVRKVNGKDSANQILILNHSCTLGILGIYIFLENIYIYIFKKLNAWNYEYEEYFCKTQNFIHKQKKIILILSLKKFRYPN